MRPGLLHTDIFFFHFDNGRHFWQIQATRDSVQNNVDLINYFTSSFQVRNKGPTPQKYVNICCNSWVFMTKLKISCKLNINFIFRTEFWLLIVINDVYYNFRGSLLWQIWRTCVNLLAENFAIIEHSRRELQALIVALKYEKGANLGESSKLMCFSNFSLIDQLGNDPRKL